jgi:heme oxygenase
MTDLGEILRTETAGLDALSGTLPFLSALHAGTLRRVSILSFLRSLSIIHAVLEGSVAWVSGGPIAELRRHVPPKMPLLLADLEALDADGIPSVTAAIRGALDYADELLIRSNHPATLIGVLYVLEGLQNRGMTLKRAYSRCLSVPEDRLSYVGCYGTGTAAHWKGFVECLNALALEDDQVKGVSQAATRCCTALDNICAELHPYDESDLEHHVAAVNCEAGNHAMPQNPLDIALALRAGKAAWLRHPYLEHRFGERGKRFMSSDSCWLLALTEQTVESATHGLDWLRNVLASRGMPTVLLEDLLMGIARELAARSPEQPHPGAPPGEGAQTVAHYERFLSSCAAERRALLDVETETRLILQFDQRFRTCAGLYVESPARLIASAWVDERSGIEGALAAVRDWFSDADRFSSDWIATVDELVVQLDEAARPSC